MFCECGMNYLSASVRCDRPIPINLKLHRVAVGDTYRFDQLSEQNERTISTAGLLWAAVVCADISIKPKLTKNLSEYSIVKLFFNHRFVYAMTGRHINWNNTRDPESDVV